MRASKKRLLSACLAALMTGTLLSGLAAALEPAEPAEPCGITAGCLLTAGHEGDCALAEEGPAEGPTEPAGPCGITTGCLLTAGHEGDCALPGEGPAEGPTEPAGPCIVTAGCLLTAGHEGDCALAEEGPVEGPTEPAGPCIVTAGCLLTAGHEGDCALAEEGPVEGPTEPAGPCIVTAGCLLTAGHEGDCALPPEPNRMDSAPVPTDAGLCEGGESCAHEAEVAGMHYDTLEEAVQGANGQTVRLLRPVTLSAPILITQDTVIDGAGETGVLTVSGSNAPGSYYREGLFHMAREDDAPVTLTLQNIELVNKNWYNSTGVSIRASNQTLNLEHVTMDTSHYCVFVGVPKDEEENVNDVTVNIQNSNLTGYAAVYYRTNSTTNMIMRPVLQAVDSRLTGRGYNGYGNGFSTIVYNGTRDARATFTGCTLSNSFDATNAAANEAIIQFNCFGGYEEGAEIALSHCTVNTRSTTAAPNLIKYTAGENLGVGNKVLVDDLTILVDENESDLIRVMRGEKELVATGKKLAQVLELELPCYGDKPGGSTSQDSAPLLASGDTVVVPVDTTLDASVTIPEGVTVLIPEGVTLTVPENMILTGGAGARLIIRGSIQDPSGSLPAGGSHVWQQGDWAVLADGITLNSAALTLQKGGEATLDATVTPADAADQTVVWASADPAVASVDQNGKVTAAGCGSTVITATVQGTDLKATCAVTVAHTLAKVEEKAPTADQPGHKAYWVCAGCGALFADPAGTAPIQAPEVIPATGGGTAPAPGTPAAPAPAPSSTPNTGDPVGGGLFLGLFGSGAAGLTALTAARAKKRRAQK